jgi:hypothetical protein
MTDRRLEGVPFLVSGFCELLVKLKVHEGSAEQVATPAVHGCCRFSGFTTMACPSRVKAGAQILDFTGPALVPSGYSPNDECGLVQPS